MLRPGSARLGVIGAWTVSLAGCASRVPAPIQVAAPPLSVVQPAAVVPAPIPVAPVDPIVELIAVSTLHFEAGERELALGHLAAAKADFNRALEILLESPPGARTEP